MAYYEADCVGCMENMQNADDKSCEPNPHESGHTNVKYHQAIFHWYVAYGYLYDDIRWKSTRISTWIHSNGINQFSAVWSNLNIILMENIYAPTSSWPRAHAYVKCHIKRFGKPMPLIEPNQRMLKWLKTKNTRMWFSASLSSFVLYLVFMQNDFGMAIFTMERNALK